MVAKQKYEILETGWYAGAYHRAGAVVDLHPKQAEYYLPPYANRLRPVEQTAAPAVQSEPAVPRARRRQK